jgi:site-specific DNA-methyltransferase (adenine-specific)
MQIFKGDCLEIMKSLPNASCDLILCDLPYGCIGAKWDCKINLEKFWEQVRRLCKNDNTPVIHFCNTRFGYELIKSNPDWFRTDLIWQKSNAQGFLNVKKRPLIQHEMIYIFSKKESYYKRIDITGDFKRNGGGRSKSNFIPSIEDMPNTSNVDNTGRRCVTSIITVANKKGKGNHPTQKPDELYEWLLKRYCPDNGTVLDPTAGSFTSCFVAQKLGLNSIGIEQNDEYFNKAKSKMESQAEKSI